MRWRLELSQVQYLRNYFKVQRSVSPVIEGSDLEFDISSQTLSNSCHVTSPDVHDYSKNTAHSNLCRGQDLFKLSVLDLHQE